MILLALTVAILCRSGGWEAVAATRDGQRTIILFGASWCAPCLVELRGLDRLAEAAAPDRIVVAWTDGNADRLVTTRPGNVEIVDRARAQLLMEKVGEDVRGLPYSVVLDANGRRCGDWRAPLTPDALMRLKADCD